jgi:hypothetical protein
MKADLNILLPRVGHFRQPEQPPPQLLDMLAQLALSGYELVALSRIINGTATIGDQCDFDAQRWTDAANAHVYQGASDASGNRLSIVSRLTIQANEVRA